MRSGSTTPATYELNSGRRGTPQREAPDRDRTSSNPPPPRARAVPGMTISSATATPALPLPPMCSSCFTTAGTATQTACQPPVAAAAAPCEPPPSASLPFKRSRDRHVGHLRHARLGRVLPPAVSAGDSQRQRLTTIVLVLKMTVNQSRLRTGGGRGGGGGQRPCGRGGGGKALWAGGGDAS